MKYPAILAIAMMLPSAAFAQTIAPQDEEQEVFTVVYDSIRSQIEARPEMRRSLVSRFVDADTTLTNPELAIVYYGQSMTPGYDPDLKYQDVDDAIAAGDVSLAMTLADEALRRNPVSLPMLFNLYGLCSISEAPALKARCQPLQSRILMLCDMIAESGMGISPEMPWCVISEADMNEYLTKYMQIQLELDRTDKGDEKAVKVSLNGLDQDVILYFDLMLANQARKALK